VKGKESKVEDALSRKFHVVAINTRSIDLRTKISKAIVTDEFFLQVKKELQKNPIRGKYEGYWVEGDDLLLYNG
jgi:hypothetical protein